jgi:urea carboxylase
MRYTFGGDEHLFVECSDEMSLDAFFNSMSMTSGIRQAGIKGITEICPANASFQIKFDPDVIHPDDILKEVQAIEQAAAKAEPVISTRIVEIPVFYNDPWTHETLMRFRERHQDPAGTDLDYAARINNYASVDDFIKAHAGSPWFVSMVGFVSGLPFMYQTVGHGGCFGCIYSVRGAGGYQMFGITPMPIYDPTQTTSYLRDFMVFFRPGDIVKFKPVDRDGYDQAVEDVDKGRFSPPIREVKFDLNEFSKDIDGYNAKLEDILHGH